MHKFLKIFAAVVALPVVLVGCKISTINYFPPHPANVRVANVIVDAPRSTWTWPGPRPGPG